MVADKSTKTEGEEQMSLLHECITGTTVHNDPRGLHPLLAHNLPNKLEIHLFQGWSCSQNVYSIHVIRQGLKMSDKSLMHPARDDQDMLSMNSLPLAKWALMHFHVFTSGFFETACIPENNQLINKSPYVMPGVHRGRSALLRGNMSILSSKLTIIQRLVCGSFLWWPVPYLFIEYNPSYYTQR